MNFESKLQTKQNFSIVIHEESKVFVIGGTALTGETPPDNIMLEPWFEYTDKVI